MLDLALVALAARVPNQSVYCRAEPLMKLRCCIGGIRQTHTCQYLGAVAVEVNVSAHPVLPGEALASKQLLRQKPRVYSSL